MPVNTLHPDYSAKVADWTLVRDCMGGQRSMQKAGAAYVPKLSDQSDAEYASYLMRGVFFNATARTHQAVHGLLFRKPPNMSGLDKITEVSKVIADADLKGNSFVQYSMNVMSEVIETARGGTLIDWSDAEKRAYCAFYAAENVINWNITRINGRMILAYVVLRETQQRSAGDDFALQDVDVYRVLRCDGTKVTSELWEMKKEQGAEAELKQTQPATELTRRKQALTEIPFVWHGAKQNSAAVDISPLIDVANVNVSHFRSSVDLEHGRHFTGLPTPIACGWTLKPGDSLKIGSGTAWVTEKENAKASFLEFTGQGLKCLTEALEEKTAQMAALGARLIEPRAKDAEAYDTVALRSNAETSTLASISRCGSESMMMILAWARWWEGNFASITEAANGIVYQFTRDFTSASMTAELLREVVSAWQQQAISQETLFYLLERGEMYGEGTTLEIERDRISANPPMPSPVDLPPEPSPTPKPKPAAK